MDLTLGLYLLALHYLYRSVMSASNSFTPGRTGTAAGSDVPIAHLDYGYVKDCTNAKELEKIIIVLRSVMIIWQYQLTFITNLYTYFTCSK